MPTVGDARSFKGKQLSGTPSSGEGWVFNGTQYVPTAMGAAYPVGWATVSGWASGGSGLASGTSGWVSGLSGAFDSLSGDWNTFYTIEWPASGAKWDGISGLAQSGYDLGVWGSGFVVAVSGKTDQTSGYLMTFLNNLQGLTTGFLYIAGGTLQSTAAGGITSGYILAASGNQMSTLYWREDSGWTLASETNSWFSGWLVNNFEPSGGKWDSGSGLADTAYALASGTSGDHSGWISGTSGLAVAISGKLDSTSGLASGGSGRAEDAYSIGSGGSGLAAAASGLASGASGLAVSVSGKLDSTSGVAQSGLDLASGTSGWASGASGGLQSGIDLASGVGQSGLDLALAGGVAIKQTITQVGHGFAVQDAIRRASAGGSYVKAQADTESGVEAVGVVSAVNGNDFTVVYGGAISGLTGLTDGSVYYVSAATAGLLTATEPDTTQYFSKPLLLAAGADSGLVMNMRAFRQQYGASGATRADVVGGRIEYVNSGQIKWAFVESNHLRLYNPSESGWQIVEVATEPTFARTDTDYSGNALVSGYNYDVYAVWGSYSGFTIELNKWTDDTTQAIVPERQDGVLVYDNGTASGRAMRWLGAVRMGVSGATAVFEWGATKRFIANAYHKQHVGMGITDSNAHTYSGAWRAFYNASGGSLCEWVQLDTAYPAISYGLGGSGNATGPWHSIRPNLNGTGGVNLINVATASAVYDRQWATVLHASGRAGYNAVYLEESGVATTFTAMNASTLINVEI